MSELLIKVRRKAQKIGNRLCNPSDKDVAALEGLLKDVPNERSAIDAWTTSVGKLINGLIFDRITKEDLAAILAGIVVYQKTGITPQASQSALVRGYENSSGLLQEVLHKALFKNSTSSGDVSSALFGLVKADVIGRVVEEMQQQGYSLFPQKLNIDLVEKIKAESTKFSYRLKGGAQSGQSIASIDPQKPPDSISAYSSSPATAALQGIIDDELFRSIASTYLGTEAAAIDSTFWYTFPHPVASSETAQLFHYDLDTVRWIKVFIYLTDVGSDNGPHEYVSTSHRPQSGVPSVLMKEYARIEDVEIDKHYPGKRRQIIGKAGTVIFGDTRCFHKGNAVVQDYRLMFSPIYAPSRIGYFHG